MWKIHPTTNYLLIKSVIFKICQNLDPYLFNYLNEQMLLLYLYIMYIYTSTYYLAPCQNEITVNCSVCLISQKWPIRYVPEHTEHYERTIVHMSEASASSYWTQYIPAVQHVIAVNGTNDRCMIHTFRIVDYMLLKNVLWSEAHLFMHCLKMCVYTGLHASLFVPLSSS